MATYGYAVRRCLKPARVSGEDWLKWTHVFLNAQDHVHPIRSSFSRNGMIYYALYPDVEKQLRATRTGRVLFSPTPIGLAMAFEEPRDAVMFKMKFY